MKAGRGALRPGKRQHLCPESSNELQEARVTGSHGMGESTTSRCRRCTVSAGPALTRRSNYPPLRRPLGRETQAEGGGRPSRSPPSSPSGHRARPAGACAEAACRGEGGTRAPPLPAPCQRGKGARPSQRLLLPQAPRTRGWDAMNPDGGPRERPEGEARRTGRKPQVSCGAGGKRGAGLRRRPALGVTLAARVRGAGGRDGAPRGRAGSGKRGKAQSAGGRPGRSREEQPLGDPDTAAPERLGLGACGTRTTEGPPRARSRAHH